MTRKPAKQETHNVTEEKEGVLLVNEACRLHQKGEIEAAEEKYRQALTKNKKLIVGWRNLGALLRGMGRKEESKYCTEQALKLNSSDGSLWGNLGNVLRDMGEYNKSCEAFQQGLKIDKESNSLKYGLAISYTRQGKFKLIVDLLTPIANSLGIKETKGNQELGEILLELGNAHHSLGQQTEAIHYWTKGSKNATGEKRLFIGLNIAQVLCSKKEFDKADNICVELEREFPNNANLIYAKGVIAKGMNQTDQAIGLFEKALELNPNYPICLNTLGLILRDIGQTHRAGECFKNAINQDGKFGAAMNNLGSVLKDIACYEEALIWLRKGAEILNNNPAAYSNVLFTLVGYELGTSQERMKEANQFGEKFGQNTFERWRDRIPEPNPNKVLTIGLISPDFCRHAVSYFVEPLLEQWNRNSLKIILFSCGEQVDDYSERLMEKADEWIDLRQKTEKECIQIILRKEVDILIDLAGHTAGNKLALMGQKPAPIQATYLGYYGTTGIKQIDYWITDKILHPPHNDANDPCTEERWRLNRCYISYRPSHKTGPVKEPPCLSKGYITFGSFNQTRKITPETANHWMEVLNKIPNSRLLLKSKNLGEIIERKRVEKLFQELGLETKRLELRGHVSNLSEHMNTYKEIDIALDTYPYTGCTTTADALWMGVPVLTVAGKTMVSRQAAAVLSGAGKEEWICTNGSDMAQKAWELSNDLDALKKMREKQRDNLKNSELLGHVELAETLSRSFREWWHRWLKKEGWPIEEKYIGWNTSKEDNKKYISNINNSTVRTVLLWIGNITESERNFYKNKGHQFVEVNKLELWGNLTKLINKSGRNQIILSKMSIKDNDLKRWAIIYPQFKFIVLNSYT